MRLLILLASFLSFGAQADFSRCPQHFAQGEPPALSATRSHELCFDSFAVLYSGETKTPVYVAQKLTPAVLSKARETEREGRFYPEARVPARDRAQLEDYRGTGWVGHLAEAAAMPNPDAMAQSFSLANIVPQAPSQNRGAWAKNVEAATRRFVARGHEAYVVTGPLYLADAPPRMIGANKVRVPDRLFKLVYVPAQCRAWVHMMDNHDEARAGKPLSYTEFEQMTGVRWLGPEAFSKCGPRT